MGPHETLTFFARITTPAAEPAHTVDLTRVRGLSGRDSLVWDQVQLQTEIGASTRLTIEPSQEDTTGPGAPLTYVLFLHNYGNAAEIAELEVLNRNPQWQYELLDADGTPLPDRNANGLQDIGPIAPFGTESQFQLRVSPAADARAGTVDSLVVRVFSSTNLAEFQDQANITTWISPVLTGLVVESDQQDVVQPGELNDYALWAEFAGNVDDVIDLRVTASQSGWNVGLLEPDKQRPILDTDSDSLPDLGVLSPGTQRRFVLRVTAPEQANLNGNPDSFRPLCVTVLGTSSRFPDLKDSAVITITLVPNLAVHVYPNPADDKVSFVFGLPGDGKVSLTLYDRATTLVSPDYRERRIRRRLARLRVEPTQRQRPRHRARHLLLRPRLHTRLRCNPASGEETGQEVSCEKSKVKSQKSKVGSRLPPIAYRLSPIACRLSACGLWPASDIGRKPLFAWFSSSDAGSCGFPLLKVGVGVRAAAMGEAFTGLCDDASALYWNPAGLAGLNRFEIMASHQQWFLDTRDEYLALTAPISPVTLGLSALYCGNGGIEFFDENNNATDTVSTHSGYATLGVGYKLNRLVSLGLTAKGLYENLQVEQGFGVCGDVGVLAGPFSPWLRGPGPQFPDP